MSFHRLLMNLLPLLLLTACATIPPPPLDYRPGAVVETLSSQVSIKIQAAERSMGGSGFMVYRRPDQFHLIMLSPFGTTIMEVFTLGEKIVLIYPGQSTAYVGRLDELPEKGGFKGWRMMRWVMDADPAASKLLSGTVERRGKLGFMEKVTFEGGLLKTKTSPAGDQVYYRKYSLINGVPLAVEIDMRNASHDRVQLTLDESEVNTPLGVSAFTPRLDGMTILPFSAMQEPQ